MKGRQAIWVLASLLAGWSVGWVPTHVANYLYGDMPPILLLTFVLPATTLAGHEVLFHMRGKNTMGPSIAGFMLLGMLTLEPTYLLLTSSDLTWRLWLLFTFFPPYSFIISAYSGAVLGLLFSCGLVFAQHTRLEIQNWMLPFRIRRQTTALE